VGVVGSGDRDLHRDSDGERGDPYGTDPGASRGQLGASRGDDRGRVRTEPDMDRRGPTITVTTGPADSTGLAARGIEVRLYDNPGNLPLPTSDNWPAVWFDKVPRAEMICASFDSSKSLPFDSTLTIDGRTERMTMQCGDTLLPADPWVYTASNPRWAWPQIDCGPVVIVVLIPGVGEPPTGPPFVQLTIPPVTARIEFWERHSA
jgi:hypothetical protein